MRLTMYAAVVVAAALIAGGTTELNGITFGEPDGTAHPHVGTLIFQRADGFYSCTGTLLSPTVMVTAGHCTEGSGEVNLNTWVSFDPVISFANIGQYPSPVDFFNAEWISAEAIPHPDYEDFNAFPNTYDVGVVILSQPVQLSTYGELPPLGFLDTLATGRGRQARQFTVVGYGVQGILRPFAGNDYARYRGTVSLVEVKSTFTGDQQSAKFTNNPGRGNGSGGSCFGDSGGPVFYGDTNVIAAVISWGITPCIGVDYQFRLDTPTAQDFITQYL